MGNEGRRRGREIIREIVKCKIQNEQMRPIKGKRIKNPSESEEIIMGVTLYMYSC